MTETKKKWLAIQPGALLVISVTITSVLLADYVGLLGSSIWSLFLGIALGNIINRQNLLKPGVKACETMFLAFGIIFLGFGLDIHSLISLGPNLLLTILVSVVCAIGTAILVGKLMGFRQTESILIGMGTAICGSSAIAACAPLISRDNKHIATSVGVVNLLGTLGIIAVPLLASFLKLSDIQSGILTGSSLQAVGHVVAASFSISNAAGEIAIVAKMGRIAMLIPSLIILGLVFKKDRQGGKLPIFIWGFLITASIATFADIDPTYLQAGKDLGKIFMTAALAAIGANILFRDFFARGSRLLLLGTIVSIIQITAVALVLIYTYND